MRYLVLLEDPAALDPGVVGVKFAGLARAVRAGFRVPPAVAVSTAAYSEFRDRGAPPEELADELSRVAADVGLDEGVSVRSSATLEDLAGRSFAGVYRTFLNVTGRPAALERIRDCWASAAGEVASSYLEQTGHGREVPEMAVIVQRMVAAAAAGVAFSVDPVAPASGEVVVEAVPGVGEELVSGHVTPWRAYVGADGTVRMDRSVKEKASEPPLRGEQWRRVAELARASAREFGGPQDIEWAVDGAGGIWLLQARPITGLDGRRLEAPAGVWTRRIAVDLWADRLTPFLADHMLRNAPRFDFSRMARFVGMPVVQPALSVIDGFLYVNCASLRQLLKMTPRGLRAPDLLDLFPPGFDPDKVPPPGIFKLLSFGLRSLCQGVVFPRSNPLLCERLSRRGLERLDRRLARIEERSPETAVQALAKVRDATESLALLQVRNQWPYFYATVFTIALRWLVVERYRRAHADFLRLISGGTQNVTSEIERAFRRIAGLVGEDPELARLIRDGEVTRLDALPETLRRELEGFLASYGCRARHRALTYRRWAEAPEEILGMVRTLVRQARAATAGTADRREPSHEILRGIPRSGRMLVGGVHRYARRHLDLREDLRFFLDKILYLIRRALLDLGEKTGMGDDVLFLTDRELEELVEARLDPAGARELATDRRRWFAQGSEAASFVVDGRPVDELPRGADVLAGIGTSPGREAGRARIVSDPTASDLDGEDILVAANTDPGWTPVLSAARGVIVEEGGLLNHCSIVARELGIPAVVGVRQATRRIPEGARITIDGDLGIVQISPPAAS